MNAQEQQAMDAGVQFGLQTLKQIPTGDQLANEAHLTGVLIVFWAALWGTMGTEYARGFIERQLESMEHGRQRDTFVPPSVQ